MYKAQVSYHVTKGLYKSQKVSVVIIKRISNLAGKGLGSAEKSCPIPGVSE